MSKQTDDVVETKAGDELVIVKRFCLALLSKKWESTSSWNPIRHQRIEREYNAAEEDLLKTFTIDEEKKEVAKTSGWSVILF